VIIRRASKDGSITEAYLPVFPEGRVDDPRAPLLVARKHGFDDEAALAKFMKNATISGVIINGIFSCDSAQRSVGASYSGVDANSLLVLDMDEKIPTQESAYLPLSIAAISAVILALALWFSKERSEPKWGQPANSARWGGPSVGQGPKLPQPRTTLTQDFRTAADKDPNKARLFGLCFLLIGSGIGKFYVWDVIEAAKKHDFVSISAKMVGLVGFLLTLGVYSTILGKLPSKTAASRLTIMGWIIVGAAVAMGFGLNGWLETEIAKYGYYR
jgi:hypothetical protein